MKETQLYRPPKPSKDPRKLKLFCRFNGKFQPQPPSGELRYVGGETRIVSVDRKIEFVKLHSKIFGLCPNSTSFSLKHKLPKSNSARSDSDNPLVLITSDEDFRCMIEEFEKLEGCGEAGRLWVYVSSNGGKNGSGNWNGCVNGLNENLVKGLDGLDENLIDGNGFESDFGHVDGMLKSSGSDSLPKMVLKQQMLAKQSDFVHGTGIGKGLGVVNQKHDNLVGELGCSDFQYPKNREILIPSFDDSGRMNVLDEKPTTTRLANSDKFVNLVQFPAPSGSIPMNQRDGNLPVETERSWFGQVLSNGSGIPTQSLNNFAMISRDTRLPIGRENIFPMEANFDSTQTHVSSIYHRGAHLAGNGFPQTSLYPGVGGWGVVQSSIPNHRVFPCYVQNHPSLRLDGQLLNGMCYPGIMENSSKAEQSQPIRVFPLNFEKCNAVSQTLNGNFYGVPTNFVRRDAEKELFMDTNMVANFPGEPEAMAYRNEIGMGCNNKFPDEESVTKLRSNYGDIEYEEVQGLENGLAPSVDIALDKLSLSPAKEAKSPAHSCGVTSNISSQSSAEKESDPVQEKEVPQNTLFGLNHDGKNINHSDLEFVKELGSGTYGTVFFGKWKGTDVAIKKIKPNCLTEGTLEEDRLVVEFWKEAHMLSQLHHPNIVAFYGVVKDGPVTNLATVTEYMVNGSLTQVFKRKDRTIDRRKRVIIARDAAFGMEYLHEKGIVHFDLKSDNFFVNMRDPQRPICKIGDLGLSKIKQKSLVSGGVRGTIPWMAPELLNSSNNNSVTEKVDVYSFGIVMWELLTGEEPYAHTPSEGTIAGIIKGDLRPEIPSWCDPVWRSLMERCWSSDPNTRPPFSEIAKELRTMSADMNIM
ncbi:hypothetical protein UlMin_003206 [Ulmus minor]